jgi:hypothetical protein
MAILNTRDELNPFTAKVFVQVFDEYIGIGSLQVATIVGDDFAVFYRNDITADSHIIVSHIVADAGSFQWTATFIHFIQVVA